MQNGSRFYGMRRIVQYTIKYSKTSGLLLCSDCLRESWERGLLSRSAVYMWCSGLLTSHIGSGSMIGWLWIGGRHCYGLSDLTTRAFVFCYFFWMFRLSLCQVLWLKCNFPALQYNGWLVTDFPLLIPQCSTTADITVDASQFPRSTFISLSVTLGPFHCA